VVGSVDSPRRRAFVDSHGRSIESRFQSRLTRRQVWLSLVETVSFTLSPSPSY